MRRLHPQRVQYEMFSHLNPFMRFIPPIAALARDNRRLVDEGNMFWQMQTWFAQWMEASLDAYRDLRDQGCEALFHAIYGSPLLQAAVGLRASDRNPRPTPGKDATHLRLVQQRIRELKNSILDGGPREAVIRALLYTRTPEGVADERGFNFLRRLREEAGQGLTLADFKRLVREQFLVLLVDERRAVEAIPAMLERDPELAARLTQQFKDLIAIVGVKSNASKERLEEIEKILRSVPRHRADKPPRQRRELEPHVGG